MAICNVCGNDYEKSFEVKINNQVYVFDCFECAIYKLSPHCAHCNCFIIGHGVEANNGYYCCAHCARSAGITDLKDHADT